ncbi:MAG: phosphate/phosphite/phosphonate ABC transporter substrate-binding protein [Dehalococcoidia bacterium]|nr:phosphate/phosphite/phosphonate ABC transporter substrate-binding protein [Dehalococcoidia bacterium]
MTSVNFPFRLSHFSLRFLIVLLLLTYGCSRSGDSQVVDFSNTIPVARPGDQPREQDSLRVAVAAMISPKETFVYYRQILDYIGTNLGKDVQLVQRKTYGEINELFGKREIDLAFVCSGPYATGKEKFGFELLATPQVQGSHFYHSYLIVNKDSNFHRLEDLKGRVFAFTDPDSNTGKLVPTYWLAQVGARPETFFGKTIYTYSHDNSILAVARGLVDGAAIDGLIWEYYHSKNPTFTSRTRIIQKSEPYGIPPLVTAKHSPPELKRRISQLLFSMHRDPEGRHILKELMIDRFIPPKEEWYDTIRLMKQRLASLHKRNYAVSKP